MSGSKIIAGLNEALAVASGDKPAPRVTINGHAYVPEEVADALAKALEPIARAADVADDVEPEWAVKVPHRVLRACRDALHAYRPPSTTKD